MPDLSHILTFLAGLMAIALDPSTPGDAMDKERHDG